MMKNLPILLLMFVQVLIILPESKIKAQIVYTDIVDTTISRTTTQGGTLTYVFDINNDNIDDYNIAVQAQLLPSACSSISPPFKTNLKAWITTMPSYSNQVGITTGFTANVIDSTLIDNAAFTWSLAPQNFLNELTFSDSGCVWDSLSTGYWMNGDSNYIALKFKIGAQIYFGWVHIYYEAALIGPDEYRIAITVLDYAFNATANQSILAGDDGLSTGLNSFPEKSNQVSLYPNPVTDKLVITYPGNSDIVITNASGVVVLKAKKTNELNLAEFTPGVYFLSVSTDTGKSVSRFIKR